jgi:hypothetical protein
MSRIEQPCVWNIAPKGGVKGHQIYLELLRSRKASCFVSVDVPSSWQNPYPL